MTMYYSKVNVGNLFIEESSNFPNLTNLIYVYGFAYRLNYW